MTRQPGHLNGSKNKNFRGSNENWRTGSTCVGFSIQYAKDSNCCIFSNTTPTYWFVTSDGSLVFDQMTLLYGFPFELIPASPVNRIETISQPSSSRSAPIYITPDGIRHSSPQRGINILRVDGKTMKLMR